MSVEIENPFVAREWSVRVFISEHDGRTTAEARLDTGSGARVIAATGTAQLNPRDHDVPEIGDELAVGRALEALSRELLAVAIGDVDARASQMEHE